MNKIIFVGPKTSGYFAEEVAQARGFDFEYVEKRANIKDQINDISFAAGSSAGFIIFDAEQYIDDAQEIAENVKKVSAAVNARPIIYARAYNPSSELVRTMLDHDIKLFITEGKASDMKDQLEKSISGFYDVNEREETIKAREIKKEEQQLFESFKTIAVAGVSERIGTTTQALQIVKYLNSKGHKAAMVEINSKKYPDSSKGMHRELSFVEKVGAWFDVDKEDEKVGMISCFNIDMFYDQSRLSDIMRMGYDYYVYDYGHYHSTDFNRTAFLKEDAKILVCGSSPTELDSTKEVAESQFYQDALLLFSFTGEDERDDLKDLMDSIPGVCGIKNGSRTFFASFAPDPFVLTDSSVYEAMLPADMTEAADGFEEPPKKKGLPFFRKGDKR